MRKHPPKVTTFSTDEGYLQLLASTCNLDPDLSLDRSFYEYSQEINALLELGYLKELEQGVFLRVKRNSEREVHPDLGKLATLIKEGRQELATFESLLSACQLFPLGNGIFLRLSLSGRRQEVQLRNRLFPHTLLTTRTSSETASEPSQSQDPNPWYLLSG